MILIPAILAASMTAPRTIGSTSVTAISCPSVGFCGGITNGPVAAVVWYAKGKVHEQNSILRGADGGLANLTAISCPVTGWCLATGDWNVYTYSHGTWSRGTFIQDDSWFEGVTCVSTKDCVAFTQDGEVFRV